jgi:two-component system, NtrC family, response regulator HydG
MILMLGSQSLKKSDDVDRAWNTHVRHLGLDIMVTVNAVLMRCLKKLHLRSGAIWLLDMCAPTRPEILVHNSTSVDIDPNLEMEKGFISFAVEAEIPLGQFTIAKFGNFFVLAKSKRLLLLIRLESEQVARDQIPEALREEMDASQFLLERCAAVELGLWPRGIVGMSRRFVQLEQQIQQAAATDLPVMIRGERGTGKEAVAQALHFQSKRNRGPFVVVNCAALSAEIGVSELFGHRRGAFTGAFENRCGKFEAANNGTIFFDEVTELPTGTHGAFLRAVEQYEIQKVGEEYARYVNVRIITATNRDPNHIRTSGFPRDLFDRLNVLFLDVPALRERKEDIPLLSEYFVRAYCEQFGRPCRYSEKRVCARQVRPPCLDPALVQWFSESSWSGNIRELRNVIFRLCTFSDSEVLGLKALQSLFPAFSDESAGLTTLDGEVSELAFSRAVTHHLQAVLRIAGGNKSAAAKLLGMPLSTLVSKMKRLGIR